MGSKATWPFNSGQRSRREAAGEQMKTGGRGRDGGGTCSPNNLARLLYINPDNN